MAPKQRKEQQQEEADVGEGPSEVSVDKNKRFRKEKRELFQCEEIYRSDVGED